MRAILSLMLLWGLLVAFCWLPAPHAQANQSLTVAIVNGKVYTMAGEPLDSGTVIIKDGRIQQVGRNLNVPPDARRIDATGKIVLPGMIDAATFLGVQEIGQVEVTNDFNETTDPITPQVRIVDAINPDSVHIPVTRINGITTVVTMPGMANAIAGQSVALRLKGRIADEMVIKAPLALNFNFGEAAKTVYGRRNRSPQTRMGIAAVIREALIRAQNYENKMRDYENKVQAKKAKGESVAELSPPDRDLKLEALLPALQGKMPVIAHAERADDILTAIRLAEEFKLKLILLDGAESYKLAKVLADKRIPVLYGPINQQPATPETAGAIYEAAGLLQRAGVQIAIQSGRDGFGESQPRNLPFMAGVAVAYGLPYLEALKAITINPAKILGIDHEVGSLEVGKSADVVVFDGDPLEPRSKVLHVFIAGEEMPLRSYQTDLYEKYR